MTNSDLAQHILKGEKKRRETDHDLIEGRINRKIDMIKDRLQHLTGEELEAVESCIFCTVRLIEVFYERNRVPVASESPTIDEQPVMGAIGPCETWGPDKPLAAPHAEHNRFCTEATPCGECQKIIKGYDGRRRVRL